MTVRELMDEVRKLKFLLDRTSANIRDDIVDGIAGDGTFILDSAPGFILDMDMLDLEAGELLSDWLEIND